MMDEIVRIVKTIIAILPFVFLCLKSRKVNLPKPERSKQFFMPVFAVVFTVAAMLLIQPINSALIRFIDNIPKQIENLAAMPFVPAAVQTVLRHVQSLAVGILHGLNLNYWIVFISNTVIVTAYLVIKRILIAILRKAVRIDGKLHSEIAGAFYEYLPEKSRWCLKENYTQARDWLGILYIAAVILSACLMLVSKKFYYDGLMRSMFYPVFGIIVVGELYFYLGGVTAREYSEDILGEDEEAYKTVNYSLLRKFLRSLFGDKLLTENTSINSDLAYGVTTDEILRDLEKSEEPKITCFASYMSALNKSGFSLDHNYLRSSLDLLNGKSILFNNPFYNDLIPYAFYPMNRSLLSHRKVLVVLGRHAIEEDIRGWLERGIEAVAGIPFLWNIAVLNSETQKADIGIVSRSSVTDNRLREANAEFLEQVGFVVILEPSKLITTAQIGLNLLVKKCMSEEDKKITYCLCDKNCDGLVDAMSHILMTELTEVSATRKHRGTSSYMCWEADGEYLHHRLVPNISRYLGIGTELSFAALKNQVSKTQWFGGETFPVTDIRWIANQYYYDLTRYAGLPTNQESMEEHFITTSDFWSAQVEPNGYITVEDESDNMFEILRDFSTRTTEQGFINIISSEYLLKDYMTANASVFEADAKAIPYIAADYTRSNRNMILRMICMMSDSPVGERVLEKEFSLLGIPVFDLHMQIWYELYLCYMPLFETSKLPKGYKEAVCAAYALPLIIDSSRWECDLIRAEENFDIKAGRLTVMYSVTDPEFLRRCVTELKSAGYVIEDEKGNRHYFGAELSGHIYPKYLPGQFFTFGGKYYEMQYLTADGQVLVRRAADHITGRPSYRQIRDYRICGTRPSEKIGAVRNVSGIRIIREFADIRVATPGYYRMEKYNDFSTAKKILFEGDENGIPERAYRNKEILCIEFPTDKAEPSDDVRYTITLLFNEVFRTIFAENQPYICAVTDDSFLSDDGQRAPLTYSLRGCGCEIRKNAIYILEDSAADLGLTVAVERNIERIFDIVFDYLEWHRETLKESLTPPPEPPVPASFDSEDETQDKPKKKGIFRRFFEAIRNWIKKIADKIREFFGRKKKKPEEAPADGSDISEEEPKETEEKGEESTESETADGSPSDETTDKDTRDGESTAQETDGESADTRKEEETAASEGEESSEEVPGDGDGSERGEQPEPLAVTVTEADHTESPYALVLNDSEEENDMRESETLTERAPYHKRYYMLYGGTDEPKHVNVAETMKYLSAIGIESRVMKQARESKNAAEWVQKNFVPGKPDARYCDFCGAEIYGVEYETLADGRDRCLCCGRSAIKTGEEFRKIFEDVKRNMESFFGIRINVGVRVKMVNSKTLHKRLGQAYIPTPQSDGRVLGVAIRDKNEYTLLVENGSPRMASMLTMAHELTHIWQYVNWNDRAIRKKYGRKMRLEIYEGMAKWVEIQYAYLINEPATAKREEIITFYRDDEYGHGFVRYRACYPFSTGTVITKDTPFLHPDTPLAPEFCGELTVQRPSDGINAGDVENMREDERARKNPKRTKNHGDSEESEEHEKKIIERDPSHVEKYAYGLLNAEEKALYDRLSEAFAVFSGKIDCALSGLSDEQVKKVLRYITMDHPEMFWVDDEAQIYFDSATKIAKGILPHYCMTKEEAEQRQKEIDAATAPILASVDDSMSDYEVTLSLYETIIRTTDYDTVGLNRQLRVGTEGTPDDLRSIYGVFVNKKAVCAGYAKAMQYLLNRCGIECAYIMSQTHAWNLVKLEGDYYHLDATWGDGSNTQKDKHYTDEVMYGCFCITSEELTRLAEHDPNVPVPKCTATKCNYFRRSGLYFDSYDFTKIRAAILRRVSEGAESVPLKFGSEKAYREALDSLVYGGKISEIYRFVSMETGIKIRSSGQCATDNASRILTFFPIRG